MLEQDREKLKDLLKNYSPKEVAGQFADIAMETASELSDDGFNDQAKELTAFAVFLEDIISGRPFLV